MIALQRASIPLAARPEGPWGLNREPAQTARRSRPARPARPARTSLGLVAALALTLLGFVRPAHAAAADGDAPVVRERWYILLLQDQRAGYMHSTTQTGAEEIRTRTVMQLDIRREAARIRVGIDSEWVETPQGRPVSVRSQTRLGNVPITRAARFVDDGIELTVEQGGQTLTQKLPPIEGEWLPPAAAQRAVDRALAQGDKTITIATVEDDLTTGLVKMTATRTIVEQTQIEAFGKVVPAIKWTSTIDRFPGVEATEFVDLEGVPIRLELDFGGIKMVQIAADRELALAKVDAPELLLNTLVKPDRAITRPRQTTRGVFELRVREGAMPALPTTPAQRAQPAQPPDAARAIVTVHRSPEAAPETLGAADRARHLGSGAMLNLDDPVLDDLLAQALPGGVKPDRDAAALSADAESLRRFVFRFISKKDLGVGFASAGETARTRAGDCTEHAVLLAALLRKAGIPSRVVSGLIYADSFAGRETIFGYHLWTQAFLPAAAPDGPGLWTDLDATLPDTTPFDATHIALGVSALAPDDTTNFLVTMGPLLGRLEIRVLEIEP